MKNKLTALITVIAALLFSAKTHAQLALDFDGVDDYVSTNLAFTQNDNFTLEAYVQYRTNIDYYQTIMGFGSAVEMKMLNGEIGVIVNNGGGGVATVNPPLNFVDGTWYHIAIVWQAGVTIIYIDGVEQTLYQQPAQLPDIQPYQLLWIGGRSNGEHWNGKIDEVRVWTVPRTQAEIAANMYTCLTGNEAGLFAYFPMDGVANDSYLSNQAIASSFGTLRNMDPATDWVSSPILCSGGCTNKHSTEQILSCGSYTWTDGNSYYYTDNTAFQVLQGATTNGCDSIIHLNLTVANNSGSYDIQTACGPFTWIDGITYTSSNYSATHTVPNAGGCDSTIYLILTYVDPLYTYDNRTECSPFTWIDGNVYSPPNYSATYMAQSVSGCDSALVHLWCDYNPVIEYDTRSECAPFTWIDGNVYTQSNYSATDTLTSVNGCDSVVYLQLNITSPSESYDNRTECGPFTWIDGNVYTPPNYSAVTTVQSSTGCDSLIHLQCDYVPILGYDSRIECAPFTWIDGNVYTQSNYSATFVLPGIGGCDSIVHLFLTITPDTIFDSYIQCGPLTWIDGNTYNESNNTASFIVFGSPCDVTHFLDLTILNSAETDTRTECAPFTWIDGSVHYTSNNTATYTVPNASGCDSVITLDLTITNPTGTDTRTECAPFTWIDGNVYFTSNTTASVIAVSPSGCDSIITLDLTIEDINANIVYTTPFELSVEFPVVGDTYQWINCATGEVAGVTSSSFSPSVNGFYTVEITTAMGCQILSGCKEVTGLGIDELSTSFTVSPNPGNGIFKLQSTVSLAVIVMNAAGQSVHVQNIQAGEDVLNLQTLAAGVYTLVATDVNSNQRSIKRINIIK